MEKSSALSFLDLIVRRRTEGSLEYSIYRKPPYADLYLYTKSEHHPSQKQAALNMLIHWTRTVCNVESLVEEVNYLRTTLRKNGYNNGIKHAPFPR
jgi:hypothetical protein